MLKGVNKFVIEINNLENDYIEKAVLFVKPEKQSLGSAFLSLQGGKLVSSLFAKADKKSKKLKGLFSVLGFVLTMLMGALIAALLFKTGIII